MVGIGGRDPEFRTAICLNSSLTHAFGNGVSTTFDASLEDCLMHPRASISVVMLLQSNRLYGFNNLRLLGFGGTVIATDELIVSCASDFESSAEHRGRPVITVLVNELQPQ